jgi:hypothetical protein
VSSAAVAALERDGAHHPLPRGHACRSKRAYSFQSKSSVRFQAQHAALREAVTVYHLQGEMMRKSLVLVAILSTISIFGLSTASAQNKPQAPASAVPPPPPEREIAADPLSLGAGGQILTGSEEFSYYAGGGVAPLGAGSGGRKDSKQVTFKAKFSAPPRILLSITALDAARQDNLRVDVFPRKITNTGFELDVGTWSNTLLYHVNVDWIAIGNK